MDHQGQFSNPPGFGQQLPVDEFWHQSQGYTYSNAVPPTQTAPFFQDYYGNLSGYGSQMKAPSTDTFSGQPLYPQYQAPNPPHERYTFTQKTRPAQAPLPPLKRQKFAQPTVDNIQAQANKMELGNGQDAGTQSECCSSCPSGEPCGELDCIPCDKTDCDEVIEELVPCTRKSCVQPVCPNPCLNVAVQQQEATLDNGIVPTERRISSWENTQWNSEVPRTASQGTRSLDGLLDPALEGFDGPDETPASGSPAPTTPSIAKNIDTPHSPNGEASTPHSSLFFQATQAENTAGVLSGTGALFNPAIDSQWHNFGQENANYQFMFQCGWSGCGQPFVSQHDYFSHFHRDHIDPQMTFDCPAQADSCPSPIKANPLEHLQTDHGYNFNMGDGGFSCPAPTCPQEETFLNPAMLHNHFDIAHAIPAHGSLQCLVDTCGNFFQDYNQLWSHVTMEHQIPQQPKDSDIDLAFPTAPIHASEPLGEAENNTNDVGLDTEVGNEVGEDLHICKWKLQPGVVCSVDCKSEDALQKHIKIAHLDLLDKRSGYICQWEGCNREEKVPKDKVGFTQRGKLERHMATHTNYKSSRCDWPGCGRLFSAPQAMRQHYLLHTGEKPWECKHCGKKFPQQSACTIHERTHTKEKPLECNICGMKFSESSNLSKHRRTHEEKQSHECTFKGCGKSFCRLDQLRRHRLVHKKKGEEDLEGESVTETGSSSGTA